MKNSWIRFKFGRKRILPSENFLRQSKEEKEIFRRRLEGSEAYKKGQ